MVRKNFLFDNGDTNDVSDSGFCCILPNPDSTEDIKYEEL